MRLDDQLAGGFRERGKNAAAVEPANARAENFVPVEIARLELGGGFMAAVVEDHRRPHALAAILIYRGHVGAAHAVVRKALIERLHAHGAHAFGNEVANGIIHHGAGQTGVQPEAVREIGGHVEFAAADMNVAVGGFAKRRDARIQPVHQRAQGKQVEGAHRLNVQTVIQIHIGGGGSRLGRVRAERVNVKETGSPGKVGRGVPGSGARGWLVEDGGWSIARLDLLGLTTITPDWGRASLSCPSPFSHRSLPFHSRRRHLGRSGFRPGKI